MITDVSVMRSCKLVTTECLHAGLPLRTFTYKEGERFGLKLTRRLELAVKSAGPDEFNPQDPHSQKLSFNLHTHAEVQAHTCMSTRTHKLERARSNTLYDKQTRRMTSDRTWQSRQPQDWGADMG